MINKFAALLSIGMASPYQILDWYGGRHTCHTASGALGQLITLYYTRYYYARHYSSNGSFKDYKMTPFINIKNKQKEYHPAFNLQQIFKQMPTVL